MTVVIADADEPSSALEVAPSAAAHDAAVAVAHVQADRDVAIAEINAETTALVVAAADAETQEDVEWLRGELDGLQNSLATQGGELSSLRQMVETLASQIAETAAAMVLLTPPQPSVTAEPIPEARPEAIESAGADGPRAAPVEPEAERAPKFRRRWL
jgi:hypothetical protein